MLGQAPSSLLSRFLNLENWDNNCATLMGLLWGLHELIQVKCLAQWLVHSICKLLLRYAYVCCRCVLAVVLPHPIMLHAISTEKYNTASALMELSVTLRKIFRFGMPPTVHFKDQYSVPNPSFRNLPEKHAWFFSLDSLEKSVSNKWVHSFNSIYWVPVVS